MDYRDLAAQTRKPIVDRSMMTMVVDVDETEITLPLEFEVCSVCDGRGRHVNPSIDAHGLSSDDFHDDPDFAEDYFGGTYDVDCYECDGHRVVPTLNEDVATHDQKTAWSDWQSEIGFDQQFAMECAAERRMGA